MTSFFKSALSLVYDDRWKTKPTTEKHFEKLIQNGMQRYITAGLITHLHDLVENKDTPDAIKRQAEKAILWAMRVSTQEQKPLLKPVKILDIIERMPAQKHSYENPWLNVQYLLRTYPDGKPSLAVNPEAYSQEFFDKVKAAYISEPEHPGPNNRANREFQADVLEQILIANPALAKNYANVAFLMQEDLKSNGKLFSYGKRAYLEHINDADAVDVFQSLQGSYQTSDKSSNELVGRFIGNLLLAKESLRTPDNIKWLMTAINDPSSSKAVEGGERTAWLPSTNELMGGAIQLLKHDPVLRRDPVVVAWMRGHIQSVAKGERYANSWAQVSFRELGTLLNKPPVDTAPKARR